MSDEDEPIAYIGSPGGDYDSEGSPARSLSPEPEARRPAKKRRDAELEDDEELALRLLRGE